MEYKDFEFHVKSTLQGQEIQLSEKQLEALLPTSKPSVSWKWILLISGILALASATFVWFSFMNNASKSTAQQTFSSDFAHSNENSSQRNDQTKSSFVSDAADTNHKVTAHDSEDAYINETKDITKSVVTQAKTHTKDHSQAVVSLHAHSASNHQYSLATLEPAAIANNHVAAAVEKNVTASQLNNEVQHSSVFLSNMSPLEGLDFRPITPQISRGISTKKVQCADFFVGRKVAFSIIPEVGIFYPFKRLEQNTSEPTQLLALRKEDETSLEGLFAALYGRMTFRRSGFYVQAGVSYARHVEKMSLSYDYIDRDTTRGIISTTVSSNGDTITNIYGDIIKETHVSGKKIVHHSFSLIDIPIVVGYERPFGDWMIGADLGVNVNVSMKANGNILSSATDFLPINTDPFSYNKNVGLQFRGTLHAGRDISEKSRLYLGIRGTYLPNSYSTDANPVAQSYSFGGTYLGLIYRL